MAKERVMKGMTLKGGVDPAPKAGERMPYWKAQELIKELEMKRDKSIQLKSRKIWI